MSHVWCWTSCPPSPATTSPARASAQMSRKPRSAAKQALDAAMWQRTPVLLRNSQRLERWLVLEQLTQTKRVTPQWMGGPASGSALDAITATLPAGESRSIRTLRT